MRKKIFIFITTIITVLLFFSTVIYTMKRGMIIFNTTSSFPIGFYKVLKKEHYNRGDLVSFCAVPSETIDKMIEQGYTQKNSLCPNQTPQLLKKIFGLEGDRVDIEKFVSVNGHIIRNSKVFKRDSRGNLLLIEPSQIIEKGNFWAMSDYNEKSYDSRYFGQVPLKNIVGKAIPIMTWN